MGLRRRVNVAGADGRLVPKPRMSSAYRGVTLEMSAFGDMKWKARATRSKRGGLDGGQEYLGMFDDEAAAARAVDVYLRRVMPALTAARKVNFPTPEELGAAGGPRVPPPQSHQRPAPAAQPPQSHRGDAAPAAARSPPGRRSKIFVLEREGGAAPSFVVVPNAGAEETRALAFAHDAAGERVRIARAGYERAPLPGRFLARFNGTAVGRVDSREAFDAAVARVCAAPRPLLLELAR